MAIITVGITAVVAVIAVAVVVVAVATFWRRCLVTVKRFAVIATGIFVRRVKAQVAGITLTRKRAILRAVATIDINTKEISDGVIRRFTV